MESLDSFLEHQIEKLVVALTPPIDLFEVAQRANADVEEREMIPEAAMKPEQDRFRIYLQSNFNQIPTYRVRRRFSLAHEIAHTFFFETRDGALRPRRDSPTGERLEAACHKGAGLLLVPNKLLKNELREQNALMDADHIVALARLFDVSLEVIIRRLYDVDAFGSDFAPILVNREKSGQTTIQFAIYPPWLKAVFPNPRRGIDFEAWFGIVNGPAAPHRSGESSSEVLLKQTPQGTLTARPVDITAASRIFELRMQS